MPSSDPTHSSRREREEKYSKNIKNSLSRVKDKEKKKVREADAQEEEEATVDGHGLNCNKRREVSLLPGRK